MRTQVEIKPDNRSHKIGIDEIVGLKEAMTKLMKPIQDAIQDKAYWARETMFEPSEYKSRDGFIPYSHNCGGLDLTIIVPKCEESDFGFLEFGEWDGTHYCDEKDKENCECPYDQDGEYDAKLRIWLKFEGLNEDGKLEFYLYMGGGNADAPYFRTEDEIEVFEASFTCSSVAGLNRAASKHIKGLLKVIGAS